MSPKPAAHMHGVDRYHLHVAKSYLGRREVMLLIAVGVIAGAISGLTLWASESLSKAQALLIDHNDSSIAPGGYFISAVALAVVAAIIVKYFCKQAAGSGLPEFKSILAGELPPSERVRLVSFRIMIAKVLGLILATGSGLSIGTEGPLVHISACIAQALMTHVTEFGEILDSPTLSKQIFAASAAVGISSAFNAPVGGLLFSVEITTTYYLISNYYKSFVAAMAGAFASSIFLITKQNIAQNSGAVLAMTISSTPFLKWELFIFALMGFSFAYLAHVYLQISQYVHLLMRPYCRNRPILTVGAVAGVTAVVIYFTGSYSSEGLRVFALASDVLTTGDLAEMRKFNFIPPLVGLLISFFARCCITLLGFNLPIPAGIFVPVFLLGGILGRFVGIVVSQASMIEEIYLPGYALVGGCAFAAGVTQTISVAVVAVELTGNISMLLPCLIASVIAAGVTRTMGLSVYDQAMFNKSLQSLQLLLRESMHNFRFASDVMQSGNEIVCIPRQCSSIYLLQILDESRDSQFPVVDDLKSRKLLGTLGRSEIFQYLRGTFHDWSMDELLAKLLPEDDHEWESRMNREATIEEHKRLRTIVYNSLTMKFCAECIHPDTEADVEAPYVPRTRQKRPTDMNSLSDYIPGSVLGGPLDMSEENMVASEMEEGKDTAGSYPHYSGNNTLPGDDISENFVPGSDIVFSDAVSGRISHCSTTDRPIFSTEGVSECSPPSVMTHVATAASDNVRPGEEILPPHPSEDQLYQEMQHSVTRNRNVSWAPTMQKDRSRSVTSAVSSQRSLDRGEIDDAAPDTDVGVQNISRPRVLSFVEIAVCKVSQFLQDLPEGTRNIPSRTPPTREASTSAAGSISQDQQLTADAELVGMKRTSSIESELDSYQLRRRTRTLSRETTITATGIRSAIKAGGGKSVTNLNVLNTACTDRTEVTADRKRENNTNNDPTMMASASSHTGDQASTDFKDALKKDIDLLEQRHQRSVEGGRENLLTVSAFPFSVTSTTSMEHIYVLLEMVKLLHIYVQEDGRLIGIISRRKLLAKLKASGNP